MEFTTFPILRVTVGWGLHLHPKKAFCHLSASVKLRSQEVLPSSSQLRNSPTSPNEERSLANS
ncbi:hypothetical protein [Fischerella thermalis]|uniref:hypothetical protein n=1 Tax=Fischerella thermalis TaxID=372787 RepID=UPI0011AF9972|nr:hypothetical protein [Fischerella thermalis]MBF1991292.1 hypothetical protein [Fischerella thermalis M58_A2018_009]MBF2061357.1 hypothetical protein [Fischerella thermalis M66_A2018_004]MBF2070615.1 hypothetical protein [Fischerella thermalis M48_A2018_028]